MRWPKPRRREVRSEAIIMTGGLNEIVTNLELEKGELHQCLNYMEMDGPYHGYASLKGYEAYDGQGKPSDVGVFPLIDEGNDQYTNLLIEAPDIEDLSTIENPLLNTGVTSNSSIYKFSESSFEFANGNYFQAISVDAAVFSTAFSSAYDIAPLVIPTRLNLTDDWTVELQLRLKPGRATTQTIFEKLTCYKLTVGTTGLLTFHISEDGLTFGKTIAMVQDPLVNTRFYHVSIVCRSGVMKMAINGTVILDALDAEITTSISAVYNTSTNLWFGSNHVTERFTGYIDEFRLSSINRWWWDFTPPSVRYSTEGYYEEWYDDVARETQRALIAAVPGEGTILGLHVYDGDLYALRNAVGSLTASLWVASSSSWVLVDSTFNPGGRLNAINWRFSGSFSGGLVMLMVDTVSVPRIWDGTTMHVLTTGGVDDATGIPDLETSPRYAKLCSVFDNRWLLAYESDDIIMSSKTDPRDFSDGFGDQLIIGDNITNLRELPGESMCIICRNSIVTLDKLEIPSSIASTPDYTFRVSNFSRSAGGIGYTVGRMLQSLFYADDRGVVNFKTVDTYGDFGAAAISKKVNRIFLNKKDLIAGAFVEREMNQYRLLFTDGTGLIFTFLNEELKGATYIDYNMPIYRMCEGEDSSGNLIKFVSGTDGFVYQIDSGTSFNGEVIPTELLTSFYGYKTPRYWKQFMRMVFEITASRGTVFNIRNVFDYYDYTFPDTNWWESTSLGTPGTWGESYWGSFTWGGSVVERIVNYIRGHGTNMSIELSTSSKYDSQHIIHNVIVDYTVEGMKE